jgi:hypothetical protein
MPRLARIRFVSVGHPRARFNDLTLDFTGQTGLADDSLLWLRNAGGKSSILNLFFHLLRPGAGEFLGGGGVEERKIGDYVGPGEVGAVVAEWELLDDTPLFGENSVVRYLTGAFYEQSSTLVNESDRPAPDVLFFAARADVRVRGLTLDTLPLYVDGTQQRLRKSLVGFKQEWQALGASNGAAEVRETDSLKVWEKILDDAKIDPRLFSYQVKMNRREGGAPELFRFTQPEEFVDFFLELVLEPETCDSIAATLDEYRASLHRLQEYTTEASLLQDVLTHLPSVGRVRASRDQLHRQVALVSRQMTQLSNQLEDSTRDEAIRATEWESRQVLATNAALQAEVEAKRLKRRGVSRRLAAARQQQQLLADRLVQAERAATSADRDKNAWAATIPLRDVRRCALKAHGLHRQLSETRAERAEEQARLVRAAVQFANALTAAATDLRARAEAAQGRARRALEAADGLRDEASAEDEAAVRLETSAAHVGERMGAAGRALVALVDAGVMDSEEGVAEAIERLNVEAGRRREEIALAGGRLRFAEAEVDQLRAVLAQDTLSEHDAATRIAGIERSIAEEQTIRESLERDAVLLQALEVEHLPLHSADLTSIVRHLRAAERAETGTGLQLAASRAENEHAIDSLRETHLLPPEADVTHVREVLRRANVPSFTGWRFVSENAPGNVYRALIGRVPEVARGVVVPDDDFDDAVQVLSSTALDLGQPIMVVAQGHADRASGPGRLVVGPTGDGLFDPAARDSELARRESRVLEISQRQQAAEENAAALREVTARCLNYLDAYPSGWLQEQSTVLASAVAAREELRIALIRTAADIESRQAALRELAGENETLHAEYTRARTNIARAEAFLGSHPEPINALQQDRDRAWAEAAERRARAQSLRGAATQRASDATPAAEDARRYGEQATEYEFELSQVRHLDGQEIRAAPGDSEALRTEYRRLDATFGTDALSALYDAARTDEEQARKRFEASIEGTGLRSDEVAAALDGLPDPADAENRQRLAERDYAQALQREAHLKAEEVSARSHLDAIAREADALGGAVGLEPVDERLSTQELTTLSEQDAGTVVELDDAARAKRSEAEHASQAAAASRHKRERLESAAREVGTLHDSYRPLLDAATRLAFPLDLGTPVPGIAVGSFPELIAEVKTQLLRFRSESDTLDAELRSAAERIQKCADSPGYAHLARESIRHLRTIAPEALERDVASLRDHLSIRLETIEAQQQELDRHRTLVVTAILNGAETGLSRLRSAAARSLLPEALGKLSGMPFLKVSTGLPEQLVEKQDLVRGLIKDLLASKPKPSGLNLIQKAVRRLAKPFTIKVLFPDPDGNQGYVPITQIGRLSGGERLTCAVMLYCTLAELRAFSQGSGASPTGLLVLDNPIGTASRAKFLKLQRELARERGIQLIYATGINDREAIRSLPVIIRLRNDRYDRRTGHQLVELEEEAPVRAARLLFPAGQEEAGAAATDRVSAMEAG